MAEPSQLRPLLQSASREETGSIAPNGEWFAYHSDESGSWQVHIRRFPDGRDPLQVSVNGGEFPLWHPDGSALYYSADDGLYEVGITWGETPRLDRPRLILEASKRDLILKQTVWDYTNTAISPDGSRFVVGQRAGSAGSSRLLLVENWIGDFEGQQ
jgi:Tol biopolymer transport system component